MRADVAPTLRAHLTDGGHKAALAAVHGTDEALAALRRRLKTSSAPTARVEASPARSTSEWFNSLRVLGLAAFGVALSLFVSHKL